jgi:hypothetical protein
MKTPVILCAALALAACGGEAKKATGGKAGGEILPASVGDAMLPYDTVRSQAPLAPQGDGGEKGKDKAEGKPKDEPKAEPSAPAEAPAAPAE